MEVLNFQPMWKMFSENKGISIRYLIVIRYLFILWQLNAVTFKTDFSQRIVIRLLQYVHGGLKLSLITVEIKINK